MQYARPMRDSIEKFLSWPLRAHAEEGSADSRRARGRGKDALVLLLLSDLVDLTVAEVLLLLDRRAGLGRRDGGERANALRPRGRPCEVALGDGHDDERLEQAEAVVLLCVRKRVLVRLQRERR